MGRRFGLVGALVLPHARPFQREGVEASTGLRKRSCRHTPNANSIHAAERRSLRCQRRSARPRPGLAPPPGLPGAAAAGAGDERPDHHLGSSRVGHFGPQRYISPIPPTSPVTCPA
ncbi:hypothetical protein LA76x_4808 [Lysobacter antibioticus]|uniref:Uncharacterized protein n=1 Tax=Lysobacter antibioticus TaxID=84531 RepID=A0A0S2FH95_LYSAN|nr:hypothetical protein LA76x_4808 [Lysobacter antibioticus]